MSMPAVSCTKTETQMTLQRHEQLRIRTALGNVTAFRSLGEAALQDLANRVCVRRVQGGSRALRDDVTYDALYLVMSGRLKVTMSGTNGREVILVRFRAHDICEMALYRGRAPGTTLRALALSTLLEITRPDLEHHIHRHPDTALGIIEEMWRKLRESDRAIGELAIHGVAERILHCLLSLGAEDGVETADGLMLCKRPTQQEFASIVGSCRETVNRTLKDLGARGLVGSVTRRWA